MSPTFPKSTGLTGSLSLFWSLNHSRVSLRSNCFAASEQGAAGGLGGLLVRVHVEMHLEVLPNWQPSHFVWRKSRPSSGEEVQVSNGIIADAEVQNEAIKQH